jgi:hypothetical protein
MVGATVPANSVPILIERKCCVAVGLGWAAKIDRTGASSPLRRFVFPVQTHKAPDARRALAPRETSWVDLPSIFGPVFRMNNEQKNFFCFLF